MMCKNIYFCLLRLVLGMIYIFFGCIMLELKYLGFVMIGLSKESCYLCFHWVFCMSFLVSSGCGMDF